MGQGQSGLPRNPRGDDAKKKDDAAKKKKKFEPRGGAMTRRHRKKKGPSVAVRIPSVYPTAKCKLRLLKLERIKDFLLMEQEFIQNQEVMKPKQEKDEEERSKVDDLRGTPMGVGTLEEMIDDNHAIVSSSVGPEYYVGVMSFVNQDMLEPGCSVLLHNKVMSVVGILADDTDPMVSVMKVDKAPLESYADIGGLESQIQEIKEAVELPLTHPELYEGIGIKPPKGVILYGEPGTGKTLLAKAVANQTSATFLRVVGSELIQKYLGDGPKLVREMFRVADDHAPSIVFIDEIDAVGSKRYDSSSGGTREIQRTMLELLNQLDGFDERGDVKVIMATNAIESLDPALIRPGRIDRKVRKEMRGFIAAEVPSRSWSSRVGVLTVDRVPAARYQDQAPHFRHPHGPHEPGRGCGPGGVRHGQGRALGRRHQGRVHGGRPAGAARAPHARDADGLPEGQGEGAVQEEGQHPRGTLSVDAAFALVQLVKTTASCITLWRFSIHFSGLNINYTGHASSRGFAGARAPELGAQRQTGRQPRG